MLKAGEQSIARGRSRLATSLVVVQFAFSVLLVTRGAVALRGDGWSLEIKLGDAVLVPFAAGACELSGDAEVLRCMPPDPGAR